MNLQELINSPSFSLGTAFIALGWLVYMSWYDIKKGERPDNMAWVLVPFVIGVLIRALAGDYYLALLATAVLVVSNRAQTSAPYRQWVTRIGIPVIILSALASMPALPVGTLAVLAFWLSWELARKFIGGTDALVSITLFLLWPWYGLLVAILLGHFAASVCMLIWDWYRKRKVTLMHVVPGMPILAGSVALFALVFLR